MISFKNDPFGFAALFGTRLQRLVPDKDFAFEFLAHTNPQRFADAESTPFASNPTVVPCSHIVYNSDEISAIGLTDCEINACIAHEIGHFVKREAFFSKGCGEMMKEMICDTFASEFGLQFYLASALIKIKTHKPEIDIADRIVSLSKEIIVYRPEWTCGRYDKKKRAAIVYNLIEGYNYYFEDDSADVLGIILDYQRNAKILIEDLTSKTGYAPEILIAFLGELLLRKLLVTSYPTTMVIRDYRTSVYNIRKQSNPIVGRIKDSLSMDSSSSAEMDYTDRVGGITSVMLELTYNCSEKCIHCYNPGATRNDNEISKRHIYKPLSVEQYKKIIDELYDEGLIKVCLTGGDPFSYADCWLIIEYLYKKEIACEIYTNGQGLVGSVKKLSKYYPCLIGISIYSGDSNIHDYITRSQGSLQKSLDVIRNLAEEAIPTVIKCCIIKPNLKSYYSVREIAISYGCAIQHEINVVDSIDGDRCVSTYLRLSPEEYKIVLCDPLIMGDCDVLCDHISPERMNQPPCRAGHNSFCITPTGEVIPCCAFHMSFGNLQTESIGSIQKNQKLIDWKNTKISLFEECGKHEYCSECQLCAGNNYNKHKDYRKAGENNCYLANIKYDYVKKRSNGYDFLQGKSLKEYLNSLEIIWETPKRLHYGE